MGWPLYHYRAQALHVVDGDTVDLVIDFGAYISRVFRCRLLGIDTPELNDPNENIRAAALRAKAALVDALSAKLLYIKSDLDKSDKYGRLLVTIYDQPEAAKSVNRLMVEWGLAAPYVGFERV